MGEAKARQARGEQPRPRTISAPEAVAGQPPAGAANDAERPSLAAAFGSGWSGPTPDGMGRAIAVTRYAAAAVAGGLAGLCVTHSTTAPWWVPVAMALAGMAWKVSDKAD